MLVVRWEGFVQTRAHGFGATQATLRLEIVLISLHGSLYSYYGAPVPALEVEHMHVHVHVLCLTPIVPVSIQPLPA